jgi:hypothetical protein
MLRRPDSQSVSAQIQESETRLSKLLEENNTLELSSLTRQYELQGVDRPILLHNLLVDLERELFTSDVSESNPDFVASALSDLQRRIPVLLGEIDALTPIVNSKRDELLAILQQVRALRPQPTRAASPLPGHSSPDVESLAREWASAVASNDKDALVRMLARGPATTTPAAFAARAAELAELQGDMQVAQVLNTHLAALIPRVEGIDTAPLDAVTGLAREFDAAATELAKIAGGNEQDAKIGGGDAWQRVEAAVEELTEMRRSIAKAAKRGVGTRVPASVVDSEREKTALRECTNTLAESIAVLGGWLAQLQEEGIVDTRIYSIDEVRGIVRRHAELID